MDVMQALKFWHRHDETMLAAIAALFLATLLLLLLRSLGKDHASHSSGASSVDLESIETALRKALADTPLRPAVGGVELSSSEADAVGGPAAGGGVAGAEAVARMQGMLAESGKKIEALRGELESTQLELAGRVAEADARQAIGGDPSSAANADMVARVKELEARLAEYEIIEDDIADLSHFKDENARLKEELEKLQVRLSAAAAPAMAGALGEAPVAAASAAAGEADAASIMKQFTEAAGEIAPVPIVAPGASEDLARVAAELAAPAAAAPVPETVDQPVDESAEAVAAPALSQSIDPAKLLAEAETLSAAPDVEAPSALSEPVDADKLLVEAKDLESIVHDDDLLSEFKDVSKTGAQPSQAGAGAATDPNTIPATNKVASKGGAA